MVGRIGKKRRKGLMIEMESEMLDRLRAVAKSKGQTLRGMVTLVLADHLKAQGVKA